MTIMHILCGVLTPPCIAAVGVIGDYTSGTTQGAARVADRVRVPLIAPSASSPALTKANDYFFRCAVLAGLPLGAVRPAG
jgi:hypothetical protein